MKTNIRSAKRSSTKATTLGNGAKPTRPRAFIPKYLNSVEYRAQDGRHVITLNLGDGVFTMLRLVAHAMEHRTPEGYVLDTVCQDAAEMLPQITGEEAKKFIEWAGGENRSAQMPVPKREITLRLSEKAYTILAGCAARDGYDSPEHMILKNEASLAAQSPGDNDEKEYAKMFGLTVAANGDTTLPNAQRK